MNITELEEKTNEELRAMAREMGVISDGAMPKRRDLMMRVLQAYAERNGNVMASGVLNIEDQGYGFLQASGRRNGAGNVYVSQSQIRRFSLRTGDQVAGQVRAPKDGERYFGLIRVEAVNGVEPEAARHRPHFEHLTPIFPMEKNQAGDDPPGALHPSHGHGLPHRTRPARAGSSPRRRSARRPFSRTSPAASAPTRPTSTSWSH